MLNLTTRLENKDGRTYCVSATWNHTASLEDVRLYVRYARVLELLK